MISKRHLYSLLPGGRWNALVLGILLAGVVLSSCRNLKKEPTDSLKPSVLRVDKVDEGATQIKYTAPDGYLYTDVELVWGPGFNPKSFCQDKKIFGLAGQALCAPIVCTDPFKSNAFRNIATTQISQSAETRTFAGVALPSGYRDVPAITTDDDGSWNNELTSQTGCTGGTACSTQNTIAAITRNAHNNGNPCGTSGTIETRIINCASQRPSASSWSGATNANGGQGSWSLVSRPTALKEVWRDNTTGYLWSTANLTRKTWCNASGARDPMDTDANRRCDTNTVSACEEALSPDSNNGTVDSGFDSETFTASGYHQAKGGMGRLSTPSIRWRLPTMADYKQAEVDGIRFIMPDMGVSEFLNTNQSSTLSNYEEWTATLPSRNRLRVFIYNGWTGEFSVADRLNTDTRKVRCVGR